MYDEITIQQLAEELDFERWRIAVKLTAIGLGEKGEYLSLWADTHRAFDFWSDHHAPVPFYQKERQNGSTPLRVLRGYGIEK